MDLAKPLENLNPRICDCEYCQSHPSAIISDLEMIIKFTGGTPNILNNGDKLANFYYCFQCGDFLAVGCKLNGILRGAVNHALFGGAALFGKPVQIQPRLLRPSEKLDRWAKLWGVLDGV